MAQNDWTDDEIFDGESSIGEILDEDGTDRETRGDPDLDESQGADGDRPTVPYQMITTGGSEVSIQTESRVFGTREFFERASEELLLSTRYGVEFGGVVLARQRGHRTVLVGLQRKHTGQSGRVAVDGKWGSILWHTHPGLRGSLAAFSIEDLEVARDTQKPLLVIGYGSLSPDVISTMALPLGVRGMLISSGVKALLALEKRGRLPNNLLRLGTAARICYPSGKIRPVVPLGATPLGHAAEDVSFMLDQGVGMVERAGQRILRRMVKKFL
jgi:hypothetical protein